MNACAQYLAQLEALEGDTEWETLGVGCSPCPDKLFGWCWDRKHCYHFCLLSHVCIKPGFCCKPFAPQTVSYIPVRWDWSKSACANQGLPGNSWGWQEGWWARRSSFLLWVTTLSTKTAPFWVLTSELKLLSCFPALYHETLRKAFCTGRNTDL